MLKPMVILSLLAWGVGAAAEPAARNPTEKWNVNFADAQCVASRTYGTAKEPLHLVLKAPPLGEVMQIAVIKGGYSPQAEQVEARIRLDEGSPLKTSMLMFSAPRSNTRVYLLNMPAAEFSLVRQAKSLSIRSDGLNETFALSQMAPLLKIVEDCVADLRAVWNVADPQGAGSPLASRASGQLASLFKPEDYPSPAMQQNKGGSLRFAVLIDESGRVADCTIIETSGVPSLDAQTCFIIKERARFQPARDSAGKPAKDAAFQRVTWRLKG